MLVIGFSAGGIPLIKRILHALPANYPLPVAIVAHLQSGKQSCLAKLLGDSSALPVAVARDKETIKGGRVYLAPPDYHLLVERQGKAAPAFALSLDEPVKSVRPSIDVLFESAAEVFESGLISVLLSGANSDGAEGLAYAMQLGGLGIVLDPAECEFTTMAEAAIKRSRVDYIVSLDEIISLLLCVHESP